MEIPNLFPYPCILIIKTRRSLRIVFPSLDGYVATFDSVAPIIFKHPHEGIPLSSVNKGNLLNSNSINIKEVIRDDLKFPVRIVQIDKVCN